MAITVYVESRPNAPNYGITMLTISRQDPERVEFLQACEKFFEEWGRSKDAELIRQAIEEIPEAADEPA
jgi:hypothetical protein